MKRQAETRATQPSTSGPDARVRKNNPASKRLNNAAKTKTPKENNPVAAATIPNTTASAMPTSGLRSAMHVPETAMPLSYFFPGNWW